MDETVKSIFKARTVASQSYGVATTEKIGVGYVEESSEYRHETLYVPPKGNPFIYAEIGRHGAFPCDEVHYVTMDEAREWVLKNCHMGFDYFLELKTLNSLSDFVQVADFYDTTCCVHHIVFKKADGNMYAIATDDGRFPESRETPFITVKSANNPQNGRDQLFIRYLAPADARVWGKDNMPLDMYIKCFGDLSKDV